MASTLQHLSFDHRDFLSKYHLLSNLILPVNGLGSGLCLSAMTAPLRHNISPAPTLAYTSDKSIPRKIEMGSRTFS